jgi:hypothetical protein
MGEERRQVKLTAVQAAAEEEGSIAGQAGSVADTREWRLSMFQRACQAERTPCDRRSALVVACRRLRPGLAVSVSFSGRWYAGELIQGLNPVGFLGASACRPSASWAHQPDWPEYRAATGVLILRILEAG